jgi:hypothetical protein
MRSLMKHFRIQGHASLRKEMRVIARGERLAPKDFGGDTIFYSVEALLRLLTPQNRELLAIIRDKKPQSIAELAKLTGRAQREPYAYLGQTRGHWFRATEERRSSQGTDDDYSFAPD